MGICFQSGNSVYGMLMVLNKGLWSFICCWGRMWFVRLFHPLVLAVSNFLSMLGWAIWWKIWNERNTKFFQDKARTPVEVLSSALFKVLFGCKKHTSVLELQLRFPCIILNKAWWAHFVTLWIFHSSMKLFLIQKKAHGPSFMLLNLRLFLAFAFKDINSKFFVLLPCWRESYVHLCYLTFTDMLALPETRAQSQELSRQKWRDRGQEVML